MTDRVWDFSGITIAITGATSGIGRAAAIEAARGGARVLLLARDSERGERVRSAISELTAQGFRGPFTPADGRVIHNAGGSEAQELAYVMAAAVAYLRALEAGGAMRQARSRVEQRQRDVFDRAGAGEQIEALEYEA